MSLLNPWVLLGIASALAAAFGFGWSTRGDHEQAAQLELALAYAKAIVDEQDRVTGVAAKAERDLADARAKARKREEALRKELENAQYRLCIVPDSGRVLLNAAIRDARSPGAADIGSPVPDAGTATRPDEHGRPASVRRGHDEPARRVQ